MAAKMPSECFLLPPVFTSKRCQAWNAGRGNHALSKGSCVNPLELGLQEFTFPSCSPLEIDITHLALHDMAKAIKTQLAFRFFF